MKTESTQMSLLRRLIQPFIAGLVALLPIVLTLGIVIWVGSLIQDFIGPESVVGNGLQRFGLAFATSGAIAYIIGLATVLGLIFFLGLLIEAGMKRRWQVFADFMLTRVPLVNIIYDGAKKLTQMVEPRKPTEMKSMSAVMCHFGGPGGTAIPAFMPTPEVFEINGMRYHVVMIPTAPVPFGGAIICLPENWVTPMNCGVDGLLNIYVSMGMTVPGFFEMQGNTLKSPENPLPRRETK